MFFLKRLDKRVYEKDTFLLFKPAVVCCGDDGSKVIARRFATIIDTATVTTVDDFTFDGNVIALSGAIATTTASGRDQILTEIKSKLAALGYTDGDGYWFESSKGSGFWGLVLSESEKAFGYLNASGNQFVPISGMIIGQKNSANASYYLSIKKRSDNDFDCTIKLLMSKPITAFSVTYDGDSITTAVPSGGSYTFVIAAADAAAEKALVVSITNADAVTVAETITEKFERYTT